jgi:hypothetical protein
MKLADAVGQEPDATRGAKSEHGAKSSTMKALVYHGPGQRAWEDKPRPTLRESGDAIVRMTTSTICGTDLIISESSGIAISRLRRGSSTP